MAGIDLMVFYTCDQSANNYYDKDFGQSVIWDIPLLEGYHFEFVYNSSEAGSQGHLPKGILVSRIKSFKPDVLLVYGWKPQSHLRCLRYFKGKIPVLFRGDSTLVDHHFFIKTIFRRLYLTYVFHYVDYALYCGQENKAYFTNARMKEHQLRFIPHAVDNERFGSNQEDFRDQWGISPNEMVILFAGKFIPKKDPLGLVRSFLKAKNRFEHKVKLVMVGNGPLKDEIEQLAKGNDQIQIVPFVNQSYMPRVYRSADIFCLPSKGPGETWGLSVNESMASGCAILLSDMTGCRTNLLREGGNGYSFKKSLNNDLTNKLLKMTSDRKKLREMGLKSKEIISNYSYTKGGEQLGRLLDQL